MKYNELISLCIRETKSVKSAMKQMDTTGYKILFVVTENNKLIGTITDGDFRKWILLGKSLDENVLEVFNKNPIKFIEGHDLGEVKKTLVEYRIEAIPLVDADEHLVDALFWEDTFGEKYRKVEKKLEVPVIIMAGGEGKRLDPFTKILPKPLIPIGDKPMIETIIDGFVKQGIDDFFVTLNFKGNMIKVYFDSVEKDYSISYIWEDEFLGTAGSLRALPTEVGDTFIVSNCDILVKADYADLIGFHEKNNNTLTVVGSIYHHTIPYGIIQFAKEGKIENIQEKPELDFTVNTGVYVLSGDAVKSIPEGKRFDMTDLIQELLRKNENVGVYPVSSSSYIDVGQLEEYKNHIKKLRF